MQWLAYKWMRLRGWEFHGVVPPVPKMIVVGAPHTTNWDFMVFLAALHHYQLRVRYLGKHTLFRWPFGRFFEAVGGIPVDRSRPGGVVGQVTAAFAASDSMVLVVAPEGTRKAARWWKSGFLKIAESALVPIVFAGVDYERKSVSLGPAVEYDGDLTAFMDRARGFFLDKRGLHPDRETPVVLREEMRSS